MLLFLEWRLSFFIRAKNNETKKYSVGSSAYGDNK